MHLLSCKNTLFREKNPNQTFNQVIEHIGNSDWKPDTLIVTGDISHHHFLLADVSKIGLVQISHISSEIPGIDKFSSELEMKGSGIGVAVQPAIMYEMIWNLISVYILWYFRFRIYPHGMTWVLFILLYSTGRFFISFLRYDRIWAMGLTEAQWIAVVCIVVCLPIIIINLNYSNSNIFQLMTNTGKTRAERRRSAKSKNK